MNSITRLVAVVAALVLMLHSTPSWAQPFINPTASDANQNTAGGTVALSVVTTGQANTGFGFGALDFLTSGSRNSALGKFALAQTNGSGNTAVGFAALLSNDANDNTAVGYAALTGPPCEFFLCLTSGGANTATGARALEGNDTGSNNTANGVDALSSNDTGNLNTATGFQALESNIAGDNNTAIGAKALKKSTGTKNIGIGYQAGVTLTTGNNNIFIGNLGAGAESQTIRIGTAQTATFIAGVNGAVIGGAPVAVDGNGQLGVLPSSARYKSHIMPMAGHSERMLDLRPVTFVYKGDAAGATHYGLIAEEVAAVYPELVTHTATGEVQTVKYHELIPMLLNEVQRQQRELAEVAMLRKELAELRALVGQGREIAASSR